MSSFGLVVEERESRVKVTMAYSFVVLVWSTTPLAIHFSNEGFSFVEAITIRMVFAFLLCLVLLKVMGEPLIKHRRDWLSYAASGLGLFPTMLIVYWAAQFIPSGLMSVLMGFFPFFVGIFSLVVLGEKMFTVSRTVALIFAIVGLVIINRDQMALGPQSIWGVLAMILVCVFWALSAVYVKKLGGDISPVRQGTGSVAVALPFFLIAWFVLGGELPHSTSMKSIWAIAYLVIVGSVMSHILWFYVLRACSVARVSLVPLMTPVLAIAWGILFADERLSLNTTIGAGLILFSLALYQGVFAKLSSFFSFGFNPRRTVKGCGNLVVCKRVQVDVESP